MLVRSPTIDRNLKRMIKVKDERRLADKHLATLQLICQRLQATRR